MKLDSIFAELAAIIAMMAVYIPAVAGVNFKSCLADVQSGLWGPVGGTDYSGHVVSNISTATGLTYDLCVRACGAGSESTVWSTFSQQLGSWLLPWLALLSQLPYGADSRFDNFMSMLLTVGSPALAGYSLVFTALNGRWIARSLRQYKHHSPSTEYATHILSVWQQYPLRVHRGVPLSSLVILPQNLDWWQNLSQRLQSTPKWSVSALTSMAWVIISYAFTVVNSLIIDVTDGIHENGQGIGSQWLWLVPIVTGWLQVSPECNSAALNQASRTASAGVHVLQDNGSVLHGMVMGDGIFLVPPNDMHDPIYRDERCANPIFNYARFLPWTEMVENIIHIFHTSLEYSKGSRGAGDIEKSTDSSSTLADQGGCDQYRPPREDPTTIQCRPRGNGLLFRFCMASFLGLFLQWGTTGAAVSVNWFTPTYGEPDRGDTHNMIPTHRVLGLGCRSASNILYGILATLVWAMLVVSSFLAHRSTRMTAAGTISKSARIFGHCSILLRRLGKIIATLNAIWLVASSLFQLSNTFDQCWCNSSVLSLHGKAYNVIDFSTFDPSTGLMAGWISGVAVAAASALIFMLYVNFLVPSHY
jgi:hypothetical protein